MLPFTLYCSPFSYRSSNFAIAKVVALLLQFLYEFCRLVHGFFSVLHCIPYSYRSSNYCDSNSWSSFTLLKALAKSNGNLIAIAFRVTTIAIAIVGRAITLERKQSRKVQYCYRNIGNFNDLMAP